MASLTMSRALTGCRAFTTVRPSKKAVAVANGSKWFMRRKDSFMVEVQVGEEEPEDTAVRRFMEAVLQTRVVDKLRARKVKETKIEERKRRLRERHEIRKLGIVEPSWEELYGDDVEPKPFDDFFHDPDSADSFFSDGRDFVTGQYGGYMDGTTGYQQGGYIDQQGGYMNQQQGGYMNQQQGGYIQ